MQCQQNNKNLGEVYQVLESDILCRLNLLAEHCDVESMLQYARLGLLGRR